ncbi:prenyltransferase [Oceanobacillus jeddahense]|uniref:Prenyltransferase n=1 Tax=Oceanobacillus jeddahense TaxID=1462527 RepID=A0ABY5JZK8_9BACI|nr:prenyltransferase [Oceanobacillus jeddahense]UUI03954.1 prenyltransferase [Oceanobacillus jeddahense]
MIPAQPAITRKSIGMLLRLVAVVFSSVAAILSTVLPLLFYTDLSAGAVMAVASVLLIGAVCIHGMLTHTLNDIADFQSGTDQYSPGILSGGSKVLQTGAMSVGMLKQLGIWMTVTLLVIAIVFAFLGLTEFAILTVVGIWGAVSYSLKPFQFAYYPFVGEWLSLFPTMLILGIAAPWILLGQVPVWTWQNALINAIWCMAWVMVHHIPDRHADRKAVPLKQTSVVWGENIFGARGAKLPAMLYFILIGLLLLWTAVTRSVGAIGAGILLVYAIYLVIKMDIDDVESVTNDEKKLLILAFATAVWLGIFV